MSLTIAQKVEQWLAGNYDQATKDAITLMQSQTGDELADSFYKNLEFGTGGLRGIMGVGIPLEWLPKVLRTT